MRGEGREFSLSVSFLSLSLSSVSLSLSPLSFSFSSRSLFLSLSSGLHDCRNRALPLSTDCAIVETKRFYRCDCSRRSFPGVPWTVTLFVFLQVAKFGSIARTHPNKKSSFCIQERDSGFGWLLPSRIAWLTKPSDFTHVIVEPSKSDFGLKGVVNGL